MDFGWREAEFLADIVGASAASGKDRRDGCERCSGADEFHGSTFIID